MQTPEPATIRLAGGYLRVDPLCYSRYFGGVNTIVLLYEAETQRLLVLPIRAERAGGFLLKHVNARGDRAAAIHGFLRDHGIDELLDATYVPQWDASRQGLCIELKHSCTP